MGRDCDGSFCMTSPTNTSLTHLPPQGLLRLRVGAPETSPISTDRENSGQRPRTTRTVLGKGVRRRHRSETSGLVFPSTSGPVTVLMFRPRGTGTATGPRSQCTLCYTDSGETGTTTTTFDFYGSQGRTRGPTEETRSLVSSPTPLSRSETGDTPLKSRDVGGWKGCPPPKILSSEK